MLEVLQFHAKRAYVVVVPKIDGDELIGPYTSIKPADRDAQAWGGRVQAVLKPDSIVTRPHRRGLYALFCDDQANEHYELPTTGLMYRLWRARVYLGGFIEGLSL
jgi:hypothetical protein